MVGRKGRGGRNVVGVGMGGMMVAVVGGGCGMGA